MTKSTLSYGALLARFTLIKIELEKEKQLAILLTQETSIQNYVIGQLKNLLSTQTKPSPCTLGHKYCMIDHKKYNLLQLRTQNLRSGVVSKKVKVKLLFPQDVMMPTLSRN